MEGLTLNRYILNTVFVFLILALLSGCSGVSHGNVGNMPNFKFDHKEAEWIRNGSPIEFEGELWFPQDSSDLLLDSEVYLLGEHEGVQFFSEKIDVKPFDRLYTKFGRNKFRIFKKRGYDD